MIHNFMNDERYVLKISVIDTLNEETMSSGSIELPGEVRGDFEGMAVSGEKEWTEDRAEGVFWDVMRDFRRAQKKLEAEEEEGGEEEETI